MSTNGPSEPARVVAARAGREYFDATVSMLADLVAFRTVADPPTPNGELGEFRRLVQYLRGRADDLGLSFEDHGAALVLGLGEARDTTRRVGVLTHADVQPADPSRWSADPFTLDTRSEPGKLIGRGVEDDKASIATALFAMRALQDHQASWRRRVELIVSLHEESDWEPFRQFLRRWPPPDLNVALDAKYPLVTAEKGVGTVTLSLRADAGGAASGRATWGRIVELVGGEFRTQVPGLAKAAIRDARPGLEARLHAAVDPAWGVACDLRREHSILHVRVTGQTAHSSTPWEGRNAVAHLAALLGSTPWEPTPASALVGLINDLVGLGHLGDRFGDLAYSHPFMGPLTLSVTLISDDAAGNLTATLNLRRPVGRTQSEVTRAIETAVTAWTERARVTGLSCACDVGEPYSADAAPHVRLLLQVFRHYTGQSDAEAVAVGGGTQARLLPNGVNFGPSMPDTPYTGHSDHEFISADQLRLNLKMCAAALAELAAF